MTDEPKKIDVETALTVFGLPATPWIVDAMQRVIAERDRFMGVDLAAPGGDKIAYTLVGRRGDVLIIDDPYEYDPRTDALVERKAAEARRYFEAAYISLGPKGGAERSHFNPLFSVGPDDVACFTLTNNLADPVERPRLKGTGNFTVKGEITVNFTNEAILRQFTRGARGLAERYFRPLMSKRRFRRWRAKRRAAR